MGNGNVAGSVSEPTSWNSGETAPAHSPITRMTSPARKLMHMLGELGAISDEPAALTRTFLSPGMRRANAQVSTWMQEAGLAVREDTFGNVIGRLAATAPGGIPVTRKRTRASAPAERTLLLGSHLDTVRNAGRFDGALGVLLPIVACTELKRRNIALPYAIEVAGFSEEEGVRFPSAYLGSKGYTRQLRASDLRLRDRDGISVREALRTWNGESSRAKARSHARGHRIVGYCEVHIEQGPQLEASNLAVGVVSDIAGQTRGRLTFLGKAGHAGTTPMPLRRDALAAAAEFILQVEAHARRSPPLVATVGTLGIPSAAPNVIPGEVCLSLDVRHPRDTARTAALRQLLHRASAIGRARNVQVEWLATQDDPAVRCSPALTRLLAASVAAVQGQSITLVSGAGHDAVVLSRVAPVTMLFVRCRDGLSHHPDEFVSEADIAVALEVMIDFLARLGSEEAP